MEDNKYPKIGCRVAPDLKGSLDGFCSSRGLKVSSVLRTLVALLLQDENLKQRTIEAIAK